MPSLRADDDGGGGFERCAICGSAAVGPCARCHRAMCGDCVVLTEGGTKTFAICKSCDKRGGASLTHGWLRVLGWIAVPMLLLIALAALILLTR